MFFIGLICAFLEFTLTVKGGPEASERSRTDSCPRIPTAFYSYFGDQGDSYRACFRGSLGWTKACKLDALSGCGDDPSNAGRPRRIGQACPPVQKWRPAPLRCAAQASTMMVFSFGLVPAQAFRAQKIPSRRDSSETAKPIQII